MGKGKGKLNSWYTNTKGGFFLIELKNLKIGRNIFFLKQINYQLGSLNKIIHKNNYFLKIPLKNSNFKWNYF